MMFSSVVNVRDSLQLWEHSLITNNRDVYHKDKFFPVVLRMLLIRTHYCRQLIDIHKLCRLVHVIATPYRDIETMNWIRCYLSLHKSAKRLRKNLLILGIMKKINGLILTSRNGSRVGHVEGYR